MSLTIKLHEAKVDYSGSRVPKSVADAYALLDDYFCDDSGNLSKDAIEKVMLTFKNERDLYDRSKSNAVKSHALAWDALLREIKATLEWDDETPHATNLSSEQVKNWFKLKGRDFKEDLKPLVDAIDRQRKEWWGTKESKKSESVVTDLTKAIQDSQPEVLLSDDAATHFDDYDKMLDEFEGAYQTIVHVVGPKGTDEMMFLYVPEENIIAIGDFDVYRENATRAKDLMEKFVRGGLNEVPGNTDGLAGTDYVAIIDGNTYTSTVFIEGK